MPTKSIVTFGEVMMRLSAPGYQKLAQTGIMEVRFGGSEMNVAASLANLGMVAKHVTVLPENALGKKAKSFIRHLDINTQNVIISGDRMGLYFLEKGASMRSSQIVYDRENSAFEKLDPEWFDWAEILNDADWFHWSGITAALSDSAAKACLDAVKMAHKLNIPVSADIYFRQGQWKYGKLPSEVLPEIASYSTVLLANELNMKDLLGVDYNEQSETFEDACRKTMEKYPNIKKIVDTERQQFSSHHNRISSKLFDGEHLFQSEAQDITFIVDRVGGGDAFLGGFIYGQLNLSNDLDSLNFGTAASALKHTIEGDFNLASIEEVNSLLSGDSTGRIKR
jgi:2-dehydro-3-deoxygluconokinase